MNRMNRPTARGESLETVQGVPYRRDKIDPLDDRHLQCPTADDLPGFLSLGYEPKSTLKDRRVGVRRCEDRFLLAHFTQIKSNAH